MTIDGYTSKSVAAGLRLPRKGAIKMFVSRRINASNGKVELWECEWESRPGEMSKKVYRRYVGDDDPLAETPTVTQSLAKVICWATGRTIGNIAFTTQDTLGSFASEQGNDAILPCDITPAGKFRHGKSRWYCRTHQTHWGTNADFLAATNSGEIRCGNHQQPMSYIVNPPEFTMDTSAYSEIGVWCSLPPALSSLPILRRAPRVHIHVRELKRGAKRVDQDFGAVALLYNQNMGLFDNADISRVNVTPPSAFEFVRCIEEGIETSCVNCSKCGYPHLDLGDFATNPHRKHFCGNCGSDSIWSKLPIVSTPLKPLHDQFSKSNTYVIPDRSLNLDDERFSGFDYEIWSSTPAILWTADRPQEKGIHVHVYDGKRRIVDDTFGEVILNKTILNRSDLWSTMKKNLIV